CRSTTPAPSGPAIKLKQPRIGLVDVYGGLAPSGWTRWLLEQFEFPHEVVFPQTLDSADLNAKFALLIFTDGAYPPGQQGNQHSPESIPESFRAWLGRVTTDKTAPRLKKFVEAGGSLIAIGSSTALGESLGVAVKDHLVEND